MRSPLGIAVLVLLTCARFALAEATLPNDFSPVQGANGFSYEAIGDSRLINTQNPAPAGTSLMTFQGDAYPFDVYGPQPTYSDASNFPLIQEHADSGAMLMHPGTGGLNNGTGTANIGASIAYQAPADGCYLVSGDFARDNVNVGAGNGVDVLMVKGTALDAPLLSAHIDSSNAVDTASPFDGTGKVSFNLTVPLTAGESLRFVVFSDNQGQDGTYDTTAFRVALAAADPDKPCLNPLNPLDTNADGMVSPLDVLSVINDLNANGSHAIPVATALEVSQSYNDPNGDDMVSPGDALQIINFLNGQADGSDLSTSSFRFVAVPEPSTGSLAAGAFLLLSAGRFFRRRDIVALANSSG